MGAGLNLAETRFTNVRVRSTASPDFADVIYEIFRCGHAHGDEIPSAFSVLPSMGGFYSEWQFGHGELHMPDRVIWALLSVVVLAEVNRNETTTGTYYLSLGNERFPVREWWGRENDFRSVASRYNKVRVKLDGLEHLAMQQTAAPAGVETLLILNPPFVPGAAAS